MEGNILTGFVTLCLKVIYLKLLLPESRMLTIMLSALFITYTGPDLHAVRLQTIFDNLCVATSVVTTHSQGRDVTPHIIYSQPYRAV